MRRLFLVTILLLVLIAPLDADKEAHVLFAGVTYIHEQRSVPRPLVIHVVAIDLKAADILFLVTPGDDLADYDYTARTTTSFAQQFGIQLAINGGFFGPVREDGNDTESGVNAHGLTISQGALVTEGYGALETFATLYLSDGNDVSFHPPEWEVENAISGNFMLVQDGDILSVESDDATIHEPHPRTGVALHKNGDSLLLFVIDGRQPGISEGVTLAEFAEIIIDFGGEQALNLDGGGSSTLVLQDHDGQIIQLSSPMDHDVEGQERPVANHLGVFALPMGR